MPCPRAAERQVACQTSTSDKRVALLLQQPPSWGEIRDSLDVGQRGRNVDSVLPVLG